MYSSLKGKKLLVLGATINETTLVRRAQSFGIYVVVTDYNLDYDLSPAKKIADEVWDISWSDIERLEKKCLEVGIDGVTAGYSEFRVENLIKLCERLNLPCYITEDQLSLTRDKDKFKKECLKYNIPIVKEYLEPDLVDEYPVIVKPVDRAGSIGISIASNYNELREAYNYAMELSVSKKVIIEKYITDCKIDVYYYVNNGEISLISSCDTINAKNNNFERVVQSCWLYPSKYISQYMIKIDRQMRDLIKGLGIKFGCVTFSGFVDDKSNFSFFECGFRLEGAHQYNYCEKKYAVNFLDVFIMHALTGNTKGITRKENINNDLKCAVVNLYATSGELMHIGGIDKIAELNDCCFTMIHGRIGQVYKANTAILSKLAMFSFANKYEDIIASNIEYAYEKINIIDTNGNDMVYDYIDTQLVRNWWN